MNTFTGLAYTDLKRLTVNDIINLRMVRGVFVSNVRKQGHCLLYGCWIFR